MNAIAGEVNERLVLGTAQLGMRYGIANKDGRPAHGCVRSIVETSWAHGIREFDTAQSYGDSEQVLGLALTELGIANQAKVISKLHPKIDHRNEKSVREAVARTLNRLGVQRLYGLMIHNEDHLRALDDGMGETFRGLVKDDLVEHIGISVYSPQAALQALSFDAIDMIQIPANVLDRRMQEAGVFVHAREKRKQVYLRSVFLQGLLLMEIDELPAKVERARSVLKALHRIANEFDTSPKRMALGFVRDTYADAKVVFGAELPEQVEDNCTCWGASMSRTLLGHLEKMFLDVDEKVVDPRLWSN